MGFAIEHVEEAVHIIKTGLNATVIDGTVDISFNPQRKSDVDIIVFDDDGNILYSEHYFPTMTDMSDMDCDTNTFQNENGISRLTYDEHTTLEGVGNVWVRGVISTAQSRSTISTFILTTLCALPKIFDRFYHSDPSHSGQGSGLGLSIVKWIVSAHNGHISVNSQLGNFSEFSVTIPIEQSKLSK